MPRSSRRVPWPRRASIGHSKKRLYAYIKSSFFYRSTGCIGISRLGGSDGCEFRHRVQLVERSFAGQYLGEHAVVQHGSHGSGRDPGLRCAVRLTCARLHFAGIRKGDFPIYSRAVPVGLAVTAILFANSSIDYWTVIRFVGSRGLASPAEAWQDQVFSHAFRSIFSICRFIRTY